MAAKKTKKVKLKFPDGKQRIVKLFEGHDHDCEHNEYYMDVGPDKHEQEDNDIEGVACVHMNVGLLEGWLSGLKGESIDPNGELYEAFEELPLKDQREVWENSCFHYGIFGYDDEDADFFWKKRAKRS